MQGRPRAHPIRKCVHRVRDLCSSDPVAVRQSVIQYVLHISNFVSKRVLTTEWIV